jgi:hypothetical protein
LEPSQSHSTATPAIHQERGLRVFSQALGSGRESLLAEEELPAGIEIGRGGLLILGWEVVGEVETILRILRRLAVVAGDAAHPDAEDGAQGAALAPLGRLPPKVAMKGSARRWVHNRQPRVS